MNELLDYAGADGHNLRPLTGTLDEKMASMVDRYIQYIKSKNKRR